MFIGLNIVVVLSLASGVIHTVQKYGEYRFDFAAMTMVALVFFMVVLNIHFVNLGMFSRVLLTDDKISYYKIRRCDKSIMWEEVKDVKIIKEMKPYHRTVEVPVILISGVDDNKSDVTIKVDYRRRVYDKIIGCMDKYQEMKKEKINKYFD